MIRNWVWDKQQSVVISDGIRSVKWKPVSICAQYTDCSGKELWNMCELMRKIVDR